MKVTVVGIETIDYVSRKTNERVEGYRLYCSDPSTSPRVKGNVTQDFFISSRKAVYQDVPRIPLGIAIDMYFDNYGNVDEIIIPDDVKLSKK